MFLLFDLIFVKPQTVVFVLYCEVAQMKETHFLMFNSICLY